MMSRMNNTKAYLVLEVFTVLDGDGAFAAEALSFDGFRHGPLVEMRWVGGLLE